MRSRLEGIEKLLARESSWLTMPLGSDPIPERFEVLDAAGALFLGDERSEERRAASPHGGWNTLLAHTLALRSDGAHPKRFSARAAG